LKVAEMRRSHAPCRAGVDRNAGAEAGQRGAIGAQQEDRLDQVAARLLDRQRRQVRS
jgi:hypothetical protein